VKRNVSFYKCNLLVADQGQGKCAKHRNKVKMKAARRGSRTYSFCDQWLRANGAWKFKLRNESKKSRNEKFAI